MATPASVRNRRTGGAPRSVRPRRALLLVLAAVLGVDCGGGTAAPPVAAAVTGSASATVNDGSGPAPATKSAAPTPAPVGLDTTKGTSTAHAGVDQSGDVTLTADATHSLNGPLYRHAVVTNTAQATRDLVIRNSQRLRLSLMAAFTATMHKGTTTLTMATVTLSAAVSGNGANFRLVRTYTLEPGPPGGDTLVVISGDGQASMANGATSQPFESTTAADTLAQGTYRMTFTATLTVETDTAAAVRATPLRVATVAA